MVLKKNVFQEQTMRESIEQEFELLTVNYEHCKSELFYSESEK